MTSRLTQEDICEQVRSCLMKVKLGDAFMDGSNLDASDYDDIKKAGAGKEKMGLFLDYVSASLKMSKNVEQARERLDGMLETILREIKAFDPGTCSENNSVNDSATAARQEMAVASDGEKEEKDNKKRRQCSSTTAEPKRKKKGKHGKSFTFTRKERVQVAQQMKSDYIAQRAKIENDLDHNYKKYFGAIAFSKWKREPRRPVLLLGPYAVPPKLRETWMKMYENTKGNPKQRWYWCYWYGSPLNEAYTHARLRDVTLYEAAETRGIANLDRKIAAKIEKGKKLSKIEQQAFHGFEILETEVAKRPEERVPEDFLEDHDALLDMDEIMSIDGGTSKDTGDEEVQSDASDDSDDDRAAEPALAKAPVAKKKKAGRKNAMPVGVKKPSAMHTPQHPTGNRRKGEGFVGDEVAVRESDVTNDDNRMEDVHDAGRGDIGRAVSEIKQLIQNATSTELDHLREVASNVNVLKSNMQNLAEDAASQDASTRREMSQLKTSLTTVTSSVESIGNSIFELTCKVQNLSETLHQLVSQSTQISSLKIERKAP